MRDWPRFVDGSLSFHLDCGDNAKMQFEYALTKSGNVGAVLTQKTEGANPAVVYDNYTTSIPRFLSVSGTNSCSNNPRLCLPFRRHDASGNPTGGALPTDLLTTYAVDFYVNDFDYPAQISGQAHFSINLAPPDFLNETVAISNNVFNPAISFPRISFNPTKEANITFRIVDNSGATVASVSGLYGRLLNQVQSIPLEVSLAPDPAGYGVVADLQATEKYCSVVNTNVATTSTRLFVDVSVPSVTIDRITNSNFAAVIGSADVLGFNPENTGYSQEIIKVSFADPGNMGFPAKYTCRILSGESGNNLVQTFEEGNVADGGSIEFSWNGNLDDNTRALPGSYRFVVGAVDLAGNMASAKEQAFILDTQKPVAAFTTSPGGAEIDRIGLLAALVVKDGIPVQIPYTITDNAGIERIVARLRPVDNSGNPTGATIEKIVKIVEYPTTAAGSLLLDPSWFTLDGYYHLSLDVYDVAGNVLTDASVRDATGLEIRYVRANKHGPVVTLLVVGNPIKSGGSNSLRIQTSPHPWGAQIPYSFGYDIKLYHEGTLMTYYCNGELPLGSLPCRPLPLGASTRISGGEPVVTIPFDHANPPYSSPAPLTGRFAYEVRVWDNVGTGKGNTTTQTISFFVDRFPPMLSGGGGESVPEKFYISGQVGDPDLTNSVRERGFERYEVYYKMGEVVDLPISTAGWSTVDAYVPPHAIDRAKRNFREYPLSNIGDNQEAITAAWGNGVLAYIDGSASGGNFADGQKYSVLVIAREKNAPIDASVPTGASAVACFAVNRNTGPRIENVTIGGVSDAAIGDLAFDAENGSLPIDFRIGGGSQTSLYTATLYLFSSQSDVDGSALTEPIARRVDLNNLTNGEKYSYLWDGRDDKGSFVKDGEYRVFIVLRQNGSTGIDRAFDMEDLSKVAFSVSTPLSFTDVALAPDQITQHPNEGEFPPTNETSLNFRVSKPCEVFFEVHRCQNGPAGDCVEEYSFTVGPESVRDGAAVWHHLAWNGIDPISGSPVDVGIYHIRPFMRSTDGRETVRYQNYFVLNIVADSRENPIGAFNLPPTAYGISDVVWKTYPRGDIWSFPALTTATPLPVYVTGTQTLTRLGKGGFQGKFEKQHTKIDFRVVVKWRCFRRAIDSIEPYKGDKKDCCYGVKNAEIIDYRDESRNFAPNGSDFTFQFSTELNDYSRFVNNDFPRNDLCYASCILSGGLPPLCDIVCRTSGNSCVAVPCIPARHSKFWDDPEILWVRVYAIPTADERTHVPANDYMLPASYGQRVLENGALLCQLYSKDEPAPSAQLWPGMFHDGERGTFQKSETHDAQTSMVTGMWRFNWGQLKKSGFLPLRSLSQGQFEDNVIANDPAWPSSGSNFSAHETGWSSAIDKSKFQLKLNFYIPPGGTVTPSMGLIAPITNSTTESAWWPQMANPGQEYYVITENDGLNPNFDRFQMNFDYRIEVADGAQTDPNSEQAISGICFPLPLDLDNHRDACAPVLNAEGQAANVWDASQQWKKDPSNLAIPLGGVVANRNKDDYPSLLLDRYALESNYTVSTPGQSFSIPGLQPSDWAAYPKQLEYWLDAGTGTLTKGPTPFSFAPPQGTESSPKNLEVTINGGLLQVRYPVEEQFAIKKPLSPIQHDFVLRAPQYSGEISGYLRVGDRDNPFNTYQFLETQGFGAATFSPYGPPLLAAPAYKRIADNQGYPLPDESYALGYNGYWGLACWLKDGESVLHSGRGMNLNGWGDAGKPVKFSYINGDEADVFEIEDTDVENGLFTVRLKGNPAIRRFVPLSITITNDQFLDAKPMQLLVYDPNGSTPTWLDLYTMSYNASYRDNSAGLESGDNLLGFWDVTGKAGVFYVRLIAGKAGTSYRTTTSIRIGTDVPPHDGSDFQVFSPLNKVVLTFPGGCPYTGMASVDLVDPAEIEGLMGQVPKGFIADINPSGLMFPASDQTQLPQLSFYLTSSDIGSIGGSTDNVGEISVYYLDEKEHKLVNAGFAPTLYILQNDGSLRQDDNFTTFSDMHVLGLSGRINHTSLYGAISSSSFITIDDPSTPTSLPRATISGTVPAEYKDVVHLYVSSQPKWSPSATEYAPSQVVVSQDPEGNWQWRATVELSVEGKNYIFASVGAASAEHSPSNHVIVLKDTTKPTILDVVVSPEVCNNLTQAVLVSVEISEPGEVNLVIPSMSTNVSYEKPEETGKNIATFFVPLSGQDNAQFPDGLYQVCVTANDVAGNPSATVCNESITIDRNAPALNKLSLKMIRSQGTYSLEMKGVCTDNLACGRLQCVVLAGPPSWQWEAELAGVKSAIFEGTIAMPDWTSYVHEGQVLAVRFQATDAAGNKSLYEKMVVLEQADNLVAWQHSKPICISNTQSAAAAFGAIDQFPLRVTLDAANFTFTQALPDGRDIRFTASNGVSLPYDLEAWDAQASKATFWVHLPQIVVGVADSIRMYWGNPIATKPTSGKLVWDPNFTAVYHMADNSGSGTGSTLAGWSRNMRLYLNTAGTGAGVLDNVYDFPILVRLTSTSFSFSQAQANGQDLRFTTGDGQLLPYEIESWDASAHKAAIWVKAPVVCGGNSTQYIMMHWGNSSCQSASCPECVFETSNGYAGAWHLGENPSAGIIDATAGNCDGQAKGGMCASNRAEGMIGSGLRFDGVNDYLDMGEKPALDFKGDASVTISAWTNMRVRKEWNAVAGKGDHQYHLQFRPNDEFCVHDGVDWRPAFNPTAPQVTSDQWYLIAGTYDHVAKTVSLYRNGVLIDTTTAARIGCSGHDPFCIGVNSEMYGRHFDGVIDEVTISSKARSPAWIKLSYQNQKCDQTLVRFGEQGIASGWAHNTNAMLNTSATGAQVSSTQVGFPVLIRLNSGNFDFTQAQPDGRDIRFARLDGTPLAHEIERWDSPNTNAEVWVRVDTVYGNNTTQQFIMLWGNPLAQSTSTPTGVFGASNGFAGVWHLGQQASGTGSLGVYSNATGACHGDDFIAATGKGGVVGLGQEFNGAGDHIRLIDPTNFGLDKAFSFEAWVRNTWSFWPWWAHLWGDWTGMPSIEWAIREGRVYIAVRENLASGNGCDNLWGDQVLAKGSWNHVAAVYESGAFKVYVNGVLDSSHTNSQLNDVNNSGNNKFIGAKNDAGDFPLHGFIDEYRLSSVRRSDDWVRLSYENQKTEQSFVSLGNGGVSNVIADATMYENHATNKGTSSAVGLCGMARRFDGIDDYINGPTNGALKLRRPFTISAWVKRNALLRWEAIAGLGHITDPWRMGYEADGSQYAAVDGGYASGYNRGSHGWDFMAMTYDGSLLQLYANGMEVDRVPAHSTLGTDAAPVWIGKWLNGDFFKGVIDEVEISDTVRSASWLALAYHSQRPGQRVTSTDLVAPAGITIAVEANNAVAIRWDSTIVSADGLEIQRAVGSSATWNTVGVPSISAGLFADAGVSCGTAYRYRCRYVVGSVYSPVSTEHSIATVVCPEEWPSQFAAYPLSGVSIELSWKDNATSETGYEVQRRRHGSQADFVPLATVNADVTSVVAYSLVCETSYDFRLRMLKSGFVSPWQALDGMVSGYCNRKPEAPSELRALVSGTNAVALSWIDGSTNEEYFIVYRRASGADQYSVVDLVPANAASYVDVDAVCGQSYEYAVASFNTVAGGGVSSLCAPVGAIMPACIETDSRKLVGVSFMLLDAEGNAVNSTAKQIDVNLYVVPFGGLSVYSETVTAPVLNGYTSLVLGSTGSMSSVLGQYGRLYLEATSEGAPIDPRIAVTASTSAIVNPMVLTGEESPVGTRQAAVGALYLNTMAKRLYFKYGTSSTEWKAVQ